MRSHRPKPPDADPLQVEFKKRMARLFDLYAHNSPHIIIRMELEIILHTLHQTTGEYEDQLAAWDRAIDSLKEKRNEYDQNHKNYLDKKYEAKI